MKTIIIYGSKYGFTKSCVDDIKGRIKGSVDVYEITNLHHVNLTPYNQVIIGGSIYMGAIQKEIKAFCEARIEELRSKRIGLFISCGFVEQFEHYLKSEFPKRLIDIALTKRCFGGELQLTKMNFFEKILTKMMIFKRKKDHMSLPNKLHDQIDLFVKALTVL